MHTLRLKQQAGFEIQSKPDKLDKPNQQDKIESQVSVQVKVLPYKDLNKKINKDLFLV